MKQKYWGTLSAVSYGAGVAPWEEGTFVPLQSFSLCSGDLQVYASCSAGTDLRSPVLDCLVDMDLVAMASADPGPPLILPSQHKNASPRLPQGPAPNGTYLFAAGCWDLVCGSRVVQVSLPTLLAFWVLCMCLFMIARAGGIHVLLAARPINWALSSFPLTYQCYLPGKY